MSLKTIRLELARTPDHPEGQAGHAYEFRAPIDKAGHLDASAWPEMKRYCTVRRFEHGREVERGLLILTAGGQWAFSYARGDEDDEALFKLSQHEVVPGEYLTVTEHDHKPRTFRISQVNNWQPVV